MMMIMMMMQKHIKIYEHKIEIGMKHLQEPILAGTHWWFYHVPISRARSQANQLVLATQQSRWQMPWD